MAIHGSARRATGRPVSPPTGTTARPPATAPSPWARPKARKLRKTYPDEASARRAATAEHTRLKRAPPPSTCASPWAAPTPSPKPASPSPASNPIDATPWLITEVTHRLDNTGGFITELKMEVAP
jgi:phage protein D